MNSLLFFSVLKQNRKTTLLAGALMVRNCAVRSRTFIRMAESQHMRGGGVVLVHVVVECDLTRQTGFVLRSRSACRHRTLFVNVVRASSMLDWLCDVLGAMMCLREKPLASDTIGNGTTNPTDSTQHSRGL